MTSASPDSQNRHRQEAAETRVGWQMAGIGMTVASEVAAGAVLGLLFDYWRGHGHTGVLIGSICGISVGLYSLIRQTLALNKQLDRIAPTTGRGRPLQDNDHDDDNTDPDHPFDTAANRNNRDHRRHDQRPPEHTA